MKKTYFTINEERFALYTGIESVYGGYILETNGGPTCLNELEDAEDTTLIDQINAVTSDPSTPWEPLEEENTQYISDTLDAWGI